MQTTPHEPPALYLPQHGMFRVLELDGLEDECQRLYRACTAAHEGDWRRFAVGSFRPEESREGKEDLARRRAAAGDDVVEVTLDVLQSAGGSVCRWLHTIPLPFREVAASRRDRDAYGPWLLKGARCPSFLCTPGTKDLKIMQLKSRKTGADAVAHPSPHSRARTHTHPLMPASGLDLEIVVLRRVKSSWLLRHAMGWDGPPAIRFREADVRAEGEQGQMMLARTTVPCDSSGRPLIKPGSFDYALKADTLAPHPDFPETKTVHQVVCFADPFRAPARVQSSAIYMERQGAQLAYRYLASKHACHDRRNRNDQQEVAAVDTRAEEHEPSRFPAGKVEATAVAVAEDGAGGVADGAGGVREQGESQMRHGERVHMVDRSDTLAGLSLTYGVSMQRIREANWLMGHAITQYSSLVIPLNEAGACAKRPLSARQAGRGGCCIGATPARSRLLEREGMCLEHLIGDKTIDSDVLQDDLHVSQDALALGRMEESRVVEGKVQVHESGGGGGRCERCCRYFGTRAEREQTLCMYHPGEYRAPDIGVAGRINFVTAWSCCDQHERESQGCQRSRKHVECLTTLRVLKEMGKAKDANRLEIMPAVVSSAHVCACGKGGWGGV